MGKCIICGKYAKNDYLFCKDCYQEVKLIFDENFDDYDDENEIRNDYFDIRKKCQTYNLSEKKCDNYIITMYALADLCQFKFSNNYLFDRVEDDILEIKEKYDIKEYKNYLNNNKQNKDNKNNKETFNDKDYREQWPREHQCDDGHYVRSLSEMLIDNWLYANNYVHAYEKSVYMATAPEAVVLSDFYLPQGNVYIEFWGLEENEKYEKRKQEKIRLYDENNLNRIDLNESHIKRLNDIMPRELGKYIKK